MAWPRHIAADLADLDQYLAVADPDRVIDPDVRIKRYRDRRHGPFRVVPPKCVLVNLAEFVGYFSHKDVCRGLTKILDNFGQKM